MYFTLNIEVADANELHKELGFNKARVRVCVCFVFNSKVQLKVKSFCIVFGQMLKVILTNHGPNDPADGIVDRLHYYVSVGWAHSVNLYGTRLLDLGLNQEP